MGIEHWASVLLWLDSPVITALVRKVRALVSIPICGDTIFSCPLYLCQFFLSSIGVLEWFNQYVDSGCFHIANQVASSGCSFFKFAASFFS